MDDELQAPLVVHTVLVCDLLWSLKNGISPSAGHASVSNLFLRTMNSAAVFSRRTQAA